MCEFCKGVTNGKQPVMVQRYEICGEPPEYFCNMDITYPADEHLEEVFDLADKEDWVVISWIQDGILNISERRYDDRPIEHDTELEIDNCPMCGQKL